MIYEILKNAAPHIRCSITACLKILKAVVFRQAKTSSKCLFKILTFLLFSNKL